MTAVLLTHVVLSMTWQVSLKPGKLVTTSLLTPSYVFNKVLHFLPKVQKDSMRNSQPATQRRASARNRFVNSRGGKRQ